MKTILAILLAGLMLILLSCEKTTESDNEAPTVVITYPANNSEFAQGEIITITADANDNEGVEKVEFYVDGTKVSTDTTEPYEHVWDSGFRKDVNHTIYAKAFDTNDNSAISEVISVIITEGTGTVTDIDGNVYQTIIIGTQEWMAENLKVTHYRWGDQIPHILSYDDWTSTLDGAYCMFKNLPNNGEIYGNLYNWYAVNNPRELAPEGWHIPSKEEWQILIDYLGGYSVAGGKMKEIGLEHWDFPNIDATNESGFTALPGGYRKYDDGIFYNFGNCARFWASTEYNYNYAYGLGVYSFYSYVDWYLVSTKNGFSVRCIRD